MSSTAQAHPSSPARARARRAALVVTLAVAASELAGCAGISDPYQAVSSTRQLAPAHTRAAGAPPADAPDPAPERGGTITESLRSEQGRLAADAPRAIPQEALERYALLYVNWDAGDVVATERQLASDSLGQARAEALQAAASAAGDKELTRSGVRNAGQVITLARGQGAASGQWVIVTRERTTGEGDYAGLPASLHVIYAEVTSSHNGWVVSRWQPQN